jgi:folate-binding protein YgfZ
VLADVRVYAFRDSLVLDMEAAQAPRVREILEKARVSDDVDVRPLGSAGHLAVEGPTAASVLASVVGSEVRRLASESFVMVPLSNGREGRIVRTRSNGAAGFQVWTENGSLAEVWEGLLRSGARPLGRDAYEVLRIEAGVPRYGLDMSEGTLALEVAPESALSFTKGCYVGQEIVARGTYVGQVRRKLSGLLVDGDLPPAHGDRVTKGDREVGLVTSGTWSPTLGSAIALAILRTDEMRRSEPLHIDRGGWDLRARPHSLPFVDERS